MSSPQPKKLIEVALPLPEINDASSYDKMPGIGPHPKGIHHWWARLPLPCARAVLFASVVTDPSDDPAWKDKSESKQDAERERLFGIVRRLMGKKLHEHPEVYAEARAEMLKHCGGKLPPVLDPFSGGGSIPLEAARLGFEAHAGDLNPVAVLLNKCNLEIAPRWSGQAPVNPEDRQHIGGTQSWRGTQGLAADVRFYGRIIREQAEKTIGHFYPTVAAVQEKDGSYRHATVDEKKSLTSIVLNLKVVAWIWARTVASDNAAARGVHVPLMSTYWLSSVKGKLAWLEPVVNKAALTYRFEVRTGEPPDRNAVKTGTKLGRGGFKCLFTDTPILFAHVRSEGMAGKLGFHLSAILCEGPRSRVFLPATLEQIECARKAVVSGELETELPEHALGFRVQNYGVKKHKQLFTPRQLAAMLTLSDLVGGIYERILNDAHKAGLNPALAKSYSLAVNTFLALAVDRCTDYNNSHCVWAPTNQKVMHLFNRQAIPMVWDFGEANTLGDGVGAWSTCCEYVADCIEVLCGTGKGEAHQIDAAADWDGIREQMVVSTDPPYYDNIGYAALSDFFYVWLRRTIGELHPEIFKTVLVPKMPELTASPELFDGDKDKAKEHFESGFRKAFLAMRERLDPRFPLTVYYAFKQEDEESAPAEEAEAETNGVDLTTGWETLLEALISSGFQITATWPVRASQQWRMRAMGSNALASYIVLACRPRPVDARRIGRNEFVAELKRELPPALKHLQQGNVAPVDFAQAAIGPGMAVYSRYAAVLESNGQPLSVRKALALINGLKDELLGESIEELDKDTRWAVLWFGEDRFNWGEAGQANLLANAQATAVNGLVAAGILEVEGSNVRLISPERLPADWDPETDRRLTVWEMTHHLLRIYYYEKQGDAATAALLRQLGTKADVARDLAYKLFTVCEKNKWSAEAQGYNALVLGWPDLVKLTQQRPAARRPEQPDLPEN
jgi:putative DNA methylase